MKKAEEPLKGYYLPEKLRNQAFNEKIEEIGGLEIQLLDLDAEDVRTVVNSLKRESIKNRDLADIATSIQKTKEKWESPAYIKRKEMLEVIPELTGHSREQIEFYTFGALERTNLDKIKELQNKEIGSEVLSGPVSMDGVKSEGHLPFLERLKLAVSRWFGKGLKESQPSLISNITPSNVAGLIEISSILYSLLAKSSTLVKTPSEQPVFAPSFVSSLEKEDPELTSNIAVLNWKGGNKRIEDIVYQESDIVNAVGSNKTIEAVKKEVENLKSTRGTYHGAKFGLEFIGEEFLESESSVAEMAKLAVIDGIGHEGYACHSPAFGVYVEGGKKDAKMFAKELKNQAELIDMKIPQGKVFQAKQEQDLPTMIMEDLIGDGEMYKSKDTIVQYSPEAKFNPTCRNRVIRVMPVSGLGEVKRNLKKFQENYKRNILQTIGIAVPQERLEKMASELGKIGITNIRELGGVHFPKAGETWDGKIPIREFKVDDPIRYTSMSSNIDRELNNNLERVALYEG